MMELDTGTLSSNVKMAVDVVEVNSINLAEETAKASDRKVSYVAQRCYNGDGISDRAHTEMENIANISAHVQSNVKQENVAGHIQINVKQEQVTEHTQINVKQENATDHIQLNVNQEHVTYHNQTNGKQEHVTDHIQINVKPGYVTDQAQTNGKLEHVTDHTQINVKQENATDHIHLNVKQEHVTDHTQTNVKQEHVAGHIQINVKQEHVTDHIQTNVKQEHVTNHIQTNVEQGCVTNHTMKNVKQENITDHTHVSVKQGNSGEWKCVDSVLSVTNNSLHNSPCMFIRDKSNFPTEFNDTPLTESHENNENLSPDESGCEKSENNSTGDECSRDMISDEYYREIKMSSDEDRETRGGEVKTICDDININLDQTSICYRTDEGGTIGMYLCVENVEVNDSMPNLKCEEFQVTQNWSKENYELLQSGCKLEKADLTDTKQDPENLNFSNNSVRGMSKEDSESIHRDVTNFLNQERLKVLAAVDPQKPMFYGLSQNTEKPKNADRFPKLLQFLSEPPVFQNKILLKSSLTPNDHEKDVLQRKEVQESVRIPIDIKPQTLEILPLSANVASPVIQNITSLGTKGASKFPKLFEILTEPIKVEPLDQENTYIAATKSCSNTFDGQSTAFRVNASPTLNNDLFKYSSLLGLLSQKVVADKVKLEEVPVGVKPPVAPRKRKPIEKRNIKRKKKQTKPHREKIKQLVLKKEIVDADFKGASFPKRLKRPRPEMNMPIIPKEHFTNKVGFVKEDEILKVENAKELEAPLLPVGLYQNKIKKEPSEETVDPTKPCSCNICGKVFVQFSDLEFHLRGHFGDRPYKCHLCDRTFKHSANLYRHRRTHTGEKPYCCDICGKAFIDCTSLRKHTRTHDPKKDFFCDVCNKGFVSKINLKHHKVIHLEERPFKCEYCNKGFNKNANLKGHMKVHFGFKPWKCETCGKTFPEKNRLKMHERIHLDDKPYKCNLCDSQFAQVSNLYVHLRKHKGEKPYQCKECGKSFMMHSYLKQHMRRHTGERQFKCAVCGKEYYQRGEFNRHMRTHTGERTHFCSICNEGFIDSGSLKTHIRGIHEGKMFHCKFCNKEFLRDSNLRRHEAIHMGTKKHFCDKCGLGFLYAVELRDHMNKHAGYKPHTCDICGKKYYKMAELNQHKKIHTGEEMIYCEVCEKTFNYKMSYQKHLESERHYRKEKQSQSGEPPMKCGSTRRCGRRTKKKDVAESSSEEEEIDAERWSDLDETNFDSSTVITEEDDDVTEVSDCAIGQAKNTCKSDEQTMCTSEKEIENGEHESVSAEN